MEFNTGNPYEPGELGESYEELTPEGFEQAMEDYYDIYPEVREDHEQFDERIDDYLDENDEGKEDLGQDSIDDIVN